MSASASAGRVSVLDIWHSSNGTGAAILRRAAAHAHALPAGQRPLAEKCW
jgi:hypothetical protein